MNNYLQLDDENAINLDLKLMKLTNYQHFFTSKQDSIKLVSQKS